MSVSRGHSSCLHGRYVVNDVHRDHVFHESSDHLDAYDVHARLCVHVEYAQFCVRHRAYVPQICESHDRAYLCVHVMDVRSYDRHRAYVHQICESDDCAHFYDCVENAHSDLGLFSRSLICENDVRVHLCVLVGAGVLINDSLVVSGSTMSLIMSDVSLFGVLAGLVEFLSSVSILFLIFLSLASLALVIADHSFVSGSDS